MIKSLSGILLSMECQLQKICDKFVYEQVQQFTNQKITEFYVSATKKKKPTAAYLKYANDMLSDAMGETPDRADPVSQSQLHFATSMLSLACDERSKGMKGGLMKEKNFSSGQVSELERFFDLSIIFKYLLDIHGGIFLIQVQLGRAVIFRCSGLKNFTWS
jgi:cytoplasmic FMR1 interacting protein